MNLTKEEKVKWIIENCYNEKENLIDLTGLNFGDYKIYLSGMTASTIDMNSCKAKTIGQYGHEANLIVQDFHVADKIHQTAHTAIEVYQYGHNCSCVAND